MIELYTAILQGFLAGLGLIMMVGSQDIFILRQGIKHNHVMLVTTVSVAVDALLVFIGVNGLGALIQHSDFLRHITVTGGALFLLGYGAYAFYEMFRGKTLKINFHKGDVPKQWSHAFILALTFNLFNPHAWLDAAVILGSIGGQLPTINQRLAFTLGSVGIITLWFYTLAFAARYLAPILRKKHIWQVINFAVGCVMWGIAVTLVVEYF
jgi:L-lysine exporter family protein LysE/ArgO